jgi:formylglycine-generating enzyme
MNLMRRKPSIFLVICLLFSLASTASGQGKEMQKFNDFQIDRTEVTIGNFRKFVEATKFRSQAQVEGGGFEYGAGWERRPGWTWQRPHGVTANDQEPAVHLNYAEAQAYCEWAGKRLPTDEEWASAAYHEQRRNPPADFEFGKVYDYPTGDEPTGANCLGECGPSLSVNHGVNLRRGTGHTLAGNSKAGVNGLHEMGANVWEWIQGNGPQARTRGGSWWYGARPMHREHSAFKPKDFYAIYIGFRCASDL